MSHIIREDLEDPDRLANLYLCTILVHDNLKTGLYMPP